MSRLHRWCMLGIEVNSNWSYSILKGFSLETRWIESEWPVERCNALDPGRLRTGLWLMSDPQSLPENL